MAVSHFVPTCSDRTSSGSRSEHQLPPRASPFTTTALDSRSSSYPKAWPKLQKRSRVVGEATHSPAGKGTQRVFASCIYLNSGRRKTCSRSSRGRQQRSFPAQHKGLAELLCQSCSCTLKAHHRARTTMLWSSRSVQSMHFRLHLKKKQKKNIFLLYQAHTLACPNSSYPPATLPSPPVLVHSLQGPCYVIQAQRDFSAPDKPIARTQCILCKLLHSYAS